MQTGALDGAALGWQAISRAYAWVETTKRGRMWLHRLGPAYLFGLVAGGKLWAVSLSAQQLALGTEDAHLPVLASYQLCGAVFFALVATFFLIRREPIRRVQGPVQALVALLGSYIMLPVAFGGGETASPAVLLAADALMISGTAGAALGLAHLGRCFGIFPEARGLVTSGPYRFVRHPMYLFEFVAFLGVLLPNLTPLNAALYVAFAFFQCSRMVYEEQVLYRTFPDEYPGYVARTRRLLPGVY